MRKKQRVMIEKYPSVARMKDAIAGSRRMGSETTVEHYINAVSEFAKYLGFVATETDSDGEVTSFGDAEKALKALQSGEINAQAKADSFIDYALDDLRISHSSTRNYVFGVKKWLQLNGVKVDWDKIEMPTASETVESDRAPTKDELKTLLSHASSARDRFAIFALSSSGLRIGTFLSLTIKDVDLSPQDVVMVKVEKAKGRKFGSKRARSSGKMFMTFFSPEAKEAMQQYFNERKIAGEKLTPESPLLTDYAHKGEFITIDAYARVWNRMLKRAGLDQKGHMFHTLHIHTLRKYFRSNCVGIDASYREQWMGHKGLYLDESYFRAEESLHLAEYRKAVPHLVINTVPTDLDKLRDKIRRMEEIFARAKTADEAIESFHKFKEDEAEQPQPPKKPQADSGRQATTSDLKPSRHCVAKGEVDLIRKLNEGATLVQNLSEDKYLLKF